MILDNPQALASLQASPEDTLAPGEKQEMKEVVELVKRVHQDIENSFKATTEWRTAALESYKFVENEQHTEAELAWYKQQRRVHMTMNKILPVVRMLGGIERQNREDMRVFPRRGGSVEDANLMTELVKFVDDDNLGLWQRSRKSQDVYVTGRGFIKLNVSFDENLEGDIIFNRRNPLSVFIDPQADEWTGSDWNFVADSSWLTEEDAKEMWPEFADHIRVGDWLSGKGFKLAPELLGDKNFDKIWLDAETRRVRAIEYWYKQVQAVDVAIHVGTGDIKVVDEAFMQAYGILQPVEQQAIRFIRRRMPMIRVATVINDLLIHDRLSPFKHRQFPVIPYVGIQYYREPQGVVEYLKDSQKLHNSAYASMLNHLLRSANSGWLNKAGEGADPNQLELFGSLPGVVIDYKEEKPEKIEPTQLSNGHFALVKDADLEIRDISLLNAELRGNTTQTTVSGRAIEARQRGGLVGNEDLFDNQMLGDKLLGGQLVNMIQQFYTPERISRIIDNQIARNPESPIMQLVQGGTKPMPQLIDEMLKAEYDFVVDRSPNSITVRQTNLQTLLQAARDFPGAIPPNAIVDLMDIPESLKLQIKQHIQQQMALQAAGIGAADGGRVRQAPGVSTGGPEPARPSIEG